MIRRRLGRARRALEAAPWFRAIPPRRLKDLAPAGTLDPRALALTFDDGPDPRWTPAVLRLLGKADASATFFVCGRAARRHPQLVRAAADEGHGVGGHTWDHVRIDGLGAAGWRREVDETHELLEDLLGRPVRYFRPPWGVLSLSALARLHRRGLAAVLWSVWGEDTSHRDPAHVAALTCAGLEPGAIVLLHDACGNLLAPGGSLPRDAHADRGVTVAALPAVLAALRARDLRPVALPAEPARAAHSLLSARRIIR